MHWPESFQVNRRLRTLNLVLQAILFLTLFSGVNYLALRHTWRFDLTRNRFFSLSAETRSYLDQLARPVHVVVAFDSNPENDDIAQANRDVLSLLREYAYNSRRDQAALITIEELDVFQQGKRAKDLGINQPNVVLFTSGERQRTVRLEELYLADRNTARAFVGERAFTAAILDVTVAEKPTLYFITGHGEMDPGDVDPVRGLSLLRDELRARNFAVDTLNLVRARKIPGNAAMLLAIAPTSPFLPQEQELLRQYLAAGTGRLLLALDPGRPHGLERLLEDWGLRAEDVLVEEPSPAEFVEGGDLILQRFSPHPVTGVLIDHRIFVVTGRTRVVRPDPARAADATLSVTPLVFTSPSAWGERSFRTELVPQFNDGDLRSATGLPVAVVSDRVTAANLPFSVRGGRLLAFGTSDFFSNARILSGGNAALARNAIAWTTERDTQLNIPPRPLAQFQLALSQKELTKLRLGLLFGVPGAVALVGLFVYWTRRR